MKEIIIQGQAQGLKAALFEQGDMMEVFEEEGYVRMVGNIYRGRVENVLPGMQAAFVDVGLDKNTFLYVGDAVPQHYGEEDDEPRELARVEQVLKPRQELLVQVSKEPVGAKGARITTNLTVPGRYVVLLPATDYVGVSRKIQDPEERERLKGLALAMHPPGMGLIIRTLAEGVDGEELERDIRHLIELWTNIERRIPQTSVPGLVYRDVGLIMRLVRDLIDQDVERIIVDQEETAVILRDSLAAIEHPAARHVKVENGDLFGKYGVDDEVRKALRPKVWLRSGGYLVIHQTEALVAIDVNTGKYVGQYSLEETVVHTNLEAAREIARQLRLRNLGGIIVIDFIDMVLAESQQKVLQELEEACLSDKVKCHVFGLTQLGLVEMTRKKVGQTLASRYTRPCPSCDGGGRIMRNV